jgi:hypothetical protein
MKMVAKYFTIISFGLICPTLTCAWAPAGSAAPDLSTTIAMIKALHEQMLRTPPCHPPALNCFGHAPAEIRAVLRNYTIAALNKSKGDLASLVADLREIDDAGFTEAMGKEGLTLQRNWDTDPPFAISKKLSTGEVVITLNHFSVGALAVPSDVVVIQAFRKEGSAYSFADETGDALFGVTDYKKFVAIDASQNSVLLLVQGQVALYMGDKERARIYDFDGYRFTEEWKPEDRLDMAITISGNQIDARWLSDKIYRFGADRINCMEEKLQVGPSGLVPSDVINHGECDNFLTAK